MSVQKRIRYMGVVWALLGISVLLIFAVYRLFVNFQDIRMIPLSPLQEIALVTWTGLMLYAEGYRGFQKRFSPRFVARVLYIRDSGTIKDVALAPLFCMGFFRATSKRIAQTWLLTALIVLFVVLAGTAPAPWRGIISGGVMMGLAYGLTTIWLFTVSTMRQGVPPVDAEVS